jgi:SAM-dependent methyltransferase
MPKRIKRIDVREGYDLWAETYDATANSVVHVDARHTIDHFTPRRGELILDAGCGTGRNFPALLDRGCRIVGVDFSLGMLAVAQHNHPKVGVTQARLDQMLPFKAASFDAVLCSLVGEHLESLDDAFNAMREVLRPGGRVVFSVYHPELAMRGKEANFQRDGTEFRLGAFLYTAEDYTTAIRSAGFTDVTVREYRGDVQMAAAVPAAAKYVGAPMLLVFIAHRA